MIPKDLSGKVSPSLVWPLAPDPRIVTARAPLMSLTVPSRDRVDSLRADQGPWPPDPHAVNVFVFVE